MITRIFIVLMLVASFCAANEVAKLVKDGDIIFHTSKSSQSIAVQRATGSKYSHMGLIVHRKGRPFVFEAISTVRLTPLDQWIRRGTGSHFVVKRLRDSETILTPEGLKKLRSAAAKFAGRPYDLTFGWSDQRIYCSELVWKAYDRALGVQLGDLQKIRDFHLSDPSVRAKIRERYGKNIPLDEPVISPVAVFESPRLVTVIEH